MKKHIYTLLFIGFILPIISCQKEVLDSSIDQVDGHITNIIITAAQSDAVKTTLDGTTTKWKEGDKVTVMYKQTGKSAWYLAESDAASSDDSYATATFSVSLTDANTSKEAYAIYPANSLSQNVSGKAKITIAANQHPTGGGFDGASDILISKPFTPSASVTTQFSRPGAVLKIKINNATLSGEKLLSLSVTGDNPLAGDVLVTLSDASVDGVQNSNNTVKAIYAKDNQFSIGSSNYVYLIVMPQTLTNGSTLFINGETENYTFTKEIVLSQDIHLNAGHIVPLNIAVSSITRKDGWYRVEDASWLAAGDRVVIANNDGTKVMSNEQKSNNRDGIDISVTGGVITTFNNDAQTFYLEDGTVPGSYAFLCENGAKSYYYIYAAGSGNNYLRSTTTFNGDCSFIATLNNGYGSLVAQGENTNNLLQFYGSSLFSCYSSSQKDISIYKYHYIGESFIFNSAEALTSLGIEPPVSSGEYTNLSADIDYTVGEVKMRVTHGGGSSKTRAYNYGGNSLELRVYNNGSISFDAGDGKTITKVEFMSNAFNISASTGTLSSKTWTGSSQVVTFTGTSTTQIKAIRVTYE